jgi:hypothetical protein
MVVMPGGVSGQQPAARAHADHRRRRRGRRHPSTTTSLGTGLSVLRHAGPEGHQASGQQGRIVKGILVVSAGHTSEKVCSYPEGDSACHDEPAAETSLTSRQAGWRIEEPATVRRLGVAAANEPASWPFFHWLRRGG